MLSGITNERHPQHYLHSFTPRAAGLNTCTTFVDLDWSLLSACGLRTHSPLRRASVYILPTLNFSLPEPSLTTHLAQDRRVPVLSHLSFLPSAGLRNTIYILAVISCSVNLLKLSYSKPTKAFRSRYGEALTSASITRSLQPCCGGLKMLTHAQAFIILW